MLPHFLSISLEKGVIATQKMSFIFVKEKVSKNDLEINNESKEIGEGHTKKDFFICIKYIYFRIMRETKKFMLNIS